MHQQRPTRKSRDAHKRHVAAMVILLLRLLLLIVFATLLLLAIASSPIPLLLVSASTVALLRLLESALAGLAVHEDVAAVTLIPFGDPWGRDLRRAVVVGLLVAPLASGLTLAFFVLVDEVLDEGHLG